MRKRFGSRRVSRFRRKYAGPQPKLGQGDVQGGFTVLEYLGYSAVPPTGKPRTLSQSHHWYRVACECGTEEVHTQQQLIDQRRTRLCIGCTHLGENVENQPE